MPGIKALLQSRSEAPADLRSSAAPIAALRKDVQSLRRQRALLIIVGGLLTASVFALSASLAARSEKIVVVPGAVGEFTMTGQGASADYLEMLAMQVANVFFNRHPDDAEYFETNALRLASPVFHNDLKKMLEEERAARFTRDASQIFRVRKMNTVPAKLYVEVHGVRTTLINGEVTKNEGKIYRIQFVRNGWSLKMSDIAELTENMSVARNSTSIRSQ